MRIQIFDVEHGFCALAESGGYSMMFDCGRSSNGFRPSLYLAARRRGVDELVISHFDEDHVSDFPAIWLGNFARLITLNDTIAPHELQRAKSQEGAVGLGVAAVIACRRISPPAPIVGRFPDAEVAMFYLTYPEWPDENNRSIVTFVHTANLRIVFPGDLEAAGWRAHLQNPLFRYHLRRVNVFVASHHGRENGYCADVFKHGGPETGYCDPALVIVSDGPRRYATQEFDYGYHARGVMVHGERRSVLTTRRDGHITLIDGPQGLQVETEAGAARQTALAALLRSLSVR